MTNGWLIVAALAGAIQSMLVRFSVHRLPLAGPLAIARLATVVVLFLASARSGHLFDAGIGWFIGFALTLAFMARRSSWT